jgi:hypothetical protein
MNWRTRTNYQNGRDYGDDLPTGGPISNLRITVAWTLDLVKRTFDALLRPTESVRSPAVSSNSRVHHGFTSLGLPDAVRMTPCVFPERSEAAANDAARFQRRRSHETSPRSSEQ